MSSTLLEFEGTAEEIQAQLAGFAGQRLHVTVCSVEPLVQTPIVLPRSERTITDIILELANAIPPEELAKMPADLADQHDHYIYGWPKK